MKRGEIWTVSAHMPYAGKPRPVVIVQDEAFDATASITVCAFTTSDTDAPLFRPCIQPDKHNGLHEPCRLMIDKITTVPRTAVGRYIGRLGAADLLRLNQALLVFLGLAVSLRPQSTP